MRDSLGVAECRVALLEALDSGTSDIERWRGRELITDREVMVSFYSLAPSKPASQALLQTEVRILSKLSPTDFITLLAADVVDGRFVEVQLPRTGDPLAARLPLDHQELLEFSEQALLGLQCLHDQGILHGSLETDFYSTNNGYFYLSELGLARRLGCRTEGLAPLSCGSPEALGLLQRPLSPASDLYSLGLILRHCLLGSQAPPLTSADRLKPLTDLPAQTPPLFRRILLRLCAPDPRYRYQSARGALTDIQAHKAGKRFALGQADPRPILTSPSISGRQHEVAELWRQLNSPTKAVILAAPSGRGKSVVLEALTEELSSEGVTVFYGQGVAPEKGVAFRPVWQHLLAKIAAWLPPSERARISSTVSAAEKERLAQALPSWEFLGKPKRTIVVSEATLAESISRVLNLLSKNHNVVYILDDMQWADSLTLRLLELHDRAYRCIVAYRTEEESARLANLRERTPNIALGPLSENESRALLFSMAGPLDETVTSPIVLRANGEPLWLQSLLRGAVEENYLVHRQAKWIWRSSVELHPDTKLAEDLARRTTSLPRPTLKLLRAGCLLGKAFLTTLALEMSGTSADDLAPAIERGLVWKEAEQTIFSHDKVRESLYQGLTPEEMCQLHRKAAELLESRENTLTRDLAFHWFQGEKSAKALPYAVHAAETAMASFDYSIAQAMWNIASYDLESHMDVKEKVLVGLARSCYLSGDSAGALPLYKAALEVVQAPLLRASLIADMVSAMSKLCQFDSLIDWARNGLSGLGVKIPSGSLQVKMAAGKEMAQLLLTLQRGRTDAVSEHERAAGKLLVWLSEGALRREQPDLMLWSICTAARRLYCHDAPAEAGLAFGFCSLVFGAVGLTGPREKLNIIAEEYVAKHPEIAGHVRGMSGLRPLQDGDLEEAVQKFHLGWEFSRAYSDGWNRQVCLLHRSWAYLFLGRFDEARAGFHELLEDQDGRDVTIKLVSALGLSLTGVDAELRQSWIADFQKSYDGTVFGTLLSQLQGQLSMIASKWREAIPLLERAAQKYHVKTIVFGAGATGWLATALRLQAQTLPIEAEAQRIKLFKRITATLKLGRAHAKAWKPFAPHLLREEALLRCAQGAFAEARSLFEESERLGQRYQMPFEVAWTQYERGRFAGVAGWRDWVQDSGKGLARAQQLNGWIPGVELKLRHREGTIAKVERFDQLLEAGRRLVSLQTQISSRKHLEEEAASLLRCDGAYVVFDGTAISPEVWSDELFQLCCQRGRAVALNQSQTTPFSVLMSPLSVDGKRVAILVAWQTLVSDFFGEEELRLADYLCTLTGASLENGEFLASRDLARADLQISEKRFREFFNFAGLGTALLDSSASVIAENAQLCQILGHSLVGQTAWTVFQKFNRDELQHHFFRLADQTLDHHEQEVHLLDQQRDSVQLYLGRLPVDAARSPVFLMTISESTHQRVSEFMSYLENERGSLAGLLEEEIGTNLQHLSSLLDGSFREDTKGLMGQLQESTQELSAALRRPLLAPVNLSQKLSELIEKFSSENEQVVRVKWSGELPEIPDLMGVTLLRVLQEGLANIRKHSQATAIEIHLAAKNRLVELDLIDNGVGFPAEQWMTRRGVNRSFGLLSMRERVQFAGGRFHLASAPGRGTTIRLELPYRSSS